jgi:hypothetical protein
MRLAVILSRVRLGEYLLLRLRDNITFLFCGCFHQGSACEVPDPLVAKVLSWLQGGTFEFESSILGINVIAYFCK